MHWIIRGCTLPAVIMLHQATLLLRICSTPLPQGHGLGCRPGASTGADLQPLMPGPIMHCDPQLSGAGLQASSILLIVPTIGCFVYECALVGHVTALPRA